MNTLAGAVAVAAIPSALTDATLTNDEPALSALSTTASNVSTSDSLTAIVPTLTVSRWPASVAAATALTPLSATVCGSAWIPAGTSSTTTTLVAGEPP